MQDVFISYSRHDWGRALELAELLQRSGVSTWIDQQGIEGASSWSKEIVEAIDSCKVFLILLSVSSLESDNVARELSLAFEAKRPILPVDLEEVVLPTSVRYQLAGIQRVPFIEAARILAALSKLGVAQQARTTVTQPDTFRDKRASLMILPFEDLSPSKDNEWFVEVS
jgi:hypothetical protein